MFRGKKKEKFWGNLELGRVLTFDTKSLIHKMGITKIQNFCFAKDPVKRK